MPVRQTRTAVPRGLRAKRVLVVEDDPGMQEVIRRALQPLKYELLSAPSAEDGIGVIGEMGVDLAILDVFMAGKGGLWALDQIRESHPKTKILVVSGGGPNQSAESVLEIALRIGADMVLSKPFRIAEIRDAVDALIGPALAVQTVADEPRASNGNGHGEENDDIPKKLV